MTSGLHKVTISIMVDAPTAEIATMAAWDLAESVDGSAFLGCVVTSAIVEKVEVVRL